MSIENMPLFMLRFHRNVRLTECDWTQLPDCQLSSEQKQAWAAYRQALRDMPETEQNLENPTWPEKPGA